MVMLVISPFRRELERLAALILVAQQLMAKAVAQFGPPTSFFSFVTSTVSSSSFARMSAEVHGIVSGASLIARWIRCTISAFRDRPFARALASTLIFKGRGRRIFSCGSMRDMFARWITKALRSSLACGKPR